MFSKVVAQLTIERKRSNHSNNVRYSNILLGSVIRGQATVLMEYQVNIDTFIYRLYHSYINKDRDLGPLRDSYGIRGSPL